MRSITKQGSEGQSTVGRGPVGQGASEQAVPGQGVTGQGATRQRVTRQGGVTVTLVAGDNVVGLESGRELRTARFAARDAARRRVAMIRRQLQDGAEAGLATAEYAIATIAAAGFAGLLIVILKSGAVKTMLTDIIHSALSLG